MLLLHEWPLVLFTLLAQMAVGIILVGELLLSRVKQEAARTPIRRQSLLALALFGVASLISLGHTGTPLHSMYTVLNVSSSWLSREILMVGLTGATMLWLCVLRLRPITHPAEKMAAILTIICGLLLIASMTQVYRIASVPAWNTWGGPLAFFATPLLLGTFWQGLRLSKHSQSTGTPASAVMPLVCLAFTGMTLAAMSIPLSMPVQEVALAAKTVPAAAGTLAWWLALRIACVGVAVLLFVQRLIRIVADEVSACSDILIWIGFLLVLIGELLGRTAFYSAYARIGI